MLLVIRGKFPFDFKIQIYEMNSKMEGPLRTQNHVSLLIAIYELLVQYYNTAYNWKFVTIAEAVSWDITKDFIIVLPNVNQYGRIRIRTEVFSATITFRYMRNSHI